MVAPAWLIHVNIPNDGHLLTQCWNVGRKNMKFWKCQHTLK